MGGRLACGAAAGNVGSLAVITSVERVVGEARFIWASRAMAVDIRGHGWHCFLQFVACLHRPIARKTAWVVRTPVLPRLTKDWLRDHLLLQHAESAPVDGVGTGDATFALAPRVTIAAPRHCTFNSSTSKIRVALGGITPPAPRLP